MNIKNLIILIWVYFIVQFFIPTTFAQGNAFSFRAHFQTNKISPFAFVSLRQPVFSSAIFSDDTSILRYVWPENPLSDPNYRPQKLVSLSEANIDQAGRNSYIRADVIPDLTAMANAFENHFGEKLIAISGFRSSQYQQRLWDLGRCDEGAFCALPGRSEHQLGLAIDFFDAISSSVYHTDPRYKSFYQWMVDNAYKYGWTQSYQFGPNIDGYEIEEWHWRYVGKEMATILHSLGTSYTRYIYTTMSILDI